MPNIGSDKIPDPDRPGFYLTGPDEKEKQLRAFGGTLSPRQLEMLSEAHEDCCCAAHSEGLLCCADWILGQHGTADA